MERKLDTEQLLPYGNELVKLLANEQKDINDLNHCLNSSDTLRSRSLSDLAALNFPLLELLRVGYRDKTDNSLSDSKRVGFDPLKFTIYRHPVTDYQKKIDLCKQKTEDAKAEVASDAEIVLLQKELDEELHRETLLQEELRAITNQIKDLDEQRSSIEDRKQVLEKLEQDEMKSQMKLSMYASVTSIIPGLNDQSKISGHIVDKQKKVVEKFELNSWEMNDFDTCNAIWKMIT